MNKRFLGFHPQRGVGTGEYALVVAGGALVCLIALGTVGTQISNMFMFDFKGQMAMVSPSSNPSPAGNAPLPANTPSTPAGNVPVAPVAAAPPPATPAAPVSNYVSTKVYYDPATGKMMMSNLNNASNASNTTGADGTLGSIKMLQELFAKNPSLQTDPIQAKALAFLALASDLQQREATLDGVTPSQNKSSPAYAQYYQAGIGNAHNQLKYAYNDLMAVLGSSNSIDAAALSDVNSYAGIISSTAIRNYVLPFSSQYTEAKLAGEFIGNDPKTTPVTVNMPPSISIAVTQ